MTLWKNQFKATTIYKPVLNVKNGNVVKFGVAQLAKEFAQLVLVRVTNEKDGLQRARYKTVTSSRDIPQMKPATISDKPKLDVNITSRVQLLLVRNAA